MPTSPRWQNTISAGFLIALVAAFGAEAYRQAQTPNPTIRVVDGDTVAINGETIRIVNLDAPELPPRHKCQREADLAQKAKAELTKLTTNARISTQVNSSRPKDRYGRTLAILYANGEDVAYPMVASQTARWWMGKSSPWCS